MIRKVGDTVGDLESDVDVLLEHTANQEIRNEAARLRDTIVEMGGIDDLVEWAIASEVRHSILLLAEHAEPFLLDDIQNRQNSRPLVEDEFSVWAEEMDDSNMDI